MNISLKTGYGYILIIEADNVKIEEDIETREYQKDENGKMIINLSPKRDISTDSLDQFSTVLSDLIYYRKAVYNSTDLIESLFEKLPYENAVLLAKRLSETYTELED